MKYSGVGKGESSMEIVLALRSKTVTPLLIGGDGTVQG